MDVERRAWVPVVAYRMARCDKADRAVLHALFRKLRDQASATVATDSDQLLHDLQRFSELWESPTPTLDRYCIL